MPCANPAISMMSANQDGARKKTGAVALQYRLFGIVSRVERVKDDVRKVLPQHSQAAYASRGFNATKEARDVFLPNHNQVSAHSHKNGSTLVVCVCRLNEPPQARIQDADT